METINIAALVYSYLVVGIFVGFALLSTSEFDKFGYAVMWLPCLTIYLIKLSCAAIWRAIKS